MMFDQIKAFFKPKPLAPSNQKPISVSMGEPAGIGAEVLFKSWLARRNTHIPPFFLVGDPEFTDAQAKALNMFVPVEKIEHPSQANAVFNRALPVYPLELETEVKPGIADPANAGAVLDSIKIATKFVMDGDASAIVTLPIHKSTLYQSGFGFAGHTEYLTSLCNTTKATVMMLEIDTLRVALSTIHVSLKDAIDKITTSLIVNQTLTVERSLRHMFGIAKPRIAIAALNPHAGEHGAMGLEEIEIIIPAIEQLRERGIDISGPHPADTMFHKNARAQYDCAICLYHDQGLIPIKTLDFHGGVNITLGLPIVRTSPDHGTAFDIAGKGVADPASLIAALKRAEGLAIARAAYKTVKA
ncbi:MAG: 4-hydroxythreonine-4-phosphate dehydrogenase PdxA [Alphaproteobacteria bacterium]|nr:4-hydroxythreonine-4-phosphate dehydrogenase PdxA [Alphaproteobacteria bacterium]